MPVNNRMILILAAKPYGYVPTMTDVMDCLMKEFAGGERAIITGIDPWDSEETDYDLPASLSAKCGWQLISGLTDQPVAEGIAPNLARAIIEIEAARIKDIERRADQAMGHAWLMPQAE
jgi:hypothetical protein